jgi:hypothetical protein
LVALETIQHLSIGLLALFNTKDSYQEYKLGNSKIQLASASFFTYFSQDEHFDASYHTNLVGVGMPRPETPNLAPREIGY